MNILDRMLLITFLRGFVICFGCTMSLYIIVDMFTNLDDFGAKADGFLGVLKNIINYYGYRISMYYDRLCEAIALLAAMFTIAWMQRSNELLPILSAGVSTHRVLRPILFGAVLVLVLGIVNQELLIPRLAGVLMLERDDPDGDREVVVQGGFDPNGVHIEGRQAVRKELRIKEIYITLPELPRTPMLHISAPTATYIPPGSDPLSGGWLLTGAVPATIEPDNRPDMLIAGEPGSYFVKTREITFDAVTRNPKWYNFASATQLHYLLDHTEGARQTVLAVTYHMKITRWVVGMVLVTIGLSIILRDQTRHVFISSGLCLGMCLLFYLVVFTCRFLGNADYLSPALAAWMPVFIFMPFTIALYDAIHT